MTRRERDRIAVLERRREHLARRLMEHSGYRGLDYDRAALGWALQVIRAAEREGILRDLEAVAA